MSRKIKQKNAFKKRAKVAISRFFMLIEKVRPFSLDLVKRYNYLIHKTSTKANVSLESHQKRRFCKHCGVYFVFGENCRVRLRGHKKGNNIIYYCYECKKYSKFGYGDVKKELKK